MNRMVLGWGGAFQRMEPLRDAFQDWARGGLS